MNMTLRNTTKIVTLDIGDQCSVPARVWEGHTENGIPVIAFITRIVAERAEDLSEFERDLAEQAAPSAAVQAWPLRIIL